MVLGMLSDCDPAVVRAAGTGTVMASLDRHTRPAVETTVRRVGKIETVVAQASQEYFVAAKALPHGPNSFPRLPVRETGGRSLSRYGRQARRQE